MDCCRSFEIWQDTFAFPDFTLIHSLAQKQLKLEIFATLLIRTSFLPDPDKSLAYYVCMNVPGFFYPRDAMLAQV